MSGLRLQRVLGHSKVSGFYFFWKRKAARVFKTKMRSHLHLQRRKTLRQAG